MKGIWKPRPAPKTPVASPFEVRCMRLVATMRTGGSVFRTNDWHVPKIGYRLVHA